MENVHLIAQGPIQNYRQIPCS